MERSFKVGDHVQVQLVEGEFLGVDIWTTLVRTSNGAMVMVMVPNLVRYSRILTTRSGRGEHRLDLSIAANDVNVSLLTRIPADGIASSGMEVPPVPSRIIVSTSRGRTEVTVSLLIPDQPDHRQAIIDAVITAAGDTELEITVT